MQIDLSERQKIRNSMYVGHTSFDGDGEAISEMETSNEVNAIRTAPAQESE